ncbi:hypothetical protein PGT21_024348 [Puccinia graminis f. sp. tritici]|uniref:Uncharacterized protein n=1 Tax=Puccinia graminis f. sp. tritici TaxID=56615 RepID=A0A5B0R3A1_PUCGR|nr:hypothetical protein PGT21_024348 [Puccinia graminis f. sp. tritici]
MGDFISPMVSMLIPPGPPGRDPSERLAASSWWRTEDQRQPTRLGLVTQYLGRIFDRRLILARVRPDSWCIDPDNFLILARNCPDHFSNRSSRGSERYSRRTIAESATSTHILYLAITSHRNSRQSIAALLQPILLDRCCTLLSGQLPDWGEF